MRRKRLYICLLIVLAVPLVLKFGCMPQTLGRTGFGVTLSVTGMTRFTSVFRVLYALQKIDALVIDDATYKVTEARLPVGEVNRKPQISIKHVPSTGEISFEKVTDAPTEPILRNEIGWHLKPDAPKYFTVEVWALAGADPKQGVNEAISERVSAVLIETVERSGLQTYI
ncbi:MAG: hypothetical protein OXI63_17875 [Candidatus Poribacteria bacterium]|nr:hypothetical protein [Candidatus Poribacteria bacterium]